MPGFRSGDALIHYSDRGSGYPVLALAPGAFISAAPLWNSMAPWNPLVELTDSHRVIAMDQRHGGASVAEVTGSETWATFTRDQLGLLDHLGIERCHLVGQSIGGAFVLGLLQAAPERFERAVILATIGNDQNQDVFRSFHREQVETELRPRNPDTGPAEWESLYRNTLGVDNALFSVPNSFLPTITTPVLVLAGDDPAHTLSTSQLLASSIPDATFIQRWTDGDDLIAAGAAIKEFLVP